MNFIFLSQKKKKQSNKSIVYKKTNDWYIKWQEVEQRVTTKWCNKWQQVAYRMKANESDFRFQNETIMRCITTIYSAKSFWKYYVKQNICRSSYRSSSIKKMLLKISQFSHENTWWPEILLRGDSNTSVFLWILPNFYKNTYIEEHLREAAFAFVFNKSKRCLRGG